MDDPDYNDFIDGGDNTDYDGSDYSDDNTDDDSGDDSGDDTDDDTGDNSGVAVGGAGIGSISTSPRSATKISTATALSHVATLISSSVAAASATAVPSAGTFNYLGCSIDSFTSRTLSSLSWSGTGLSVERCASYCAAYKYMGVEFGSE